ncbi:MAG: DUF4831 family protein [Salinivirgaceae bacterium]|nr:DUF4831 family protein [Salinivirgaceae bacterium]
MTAKHIITIALATLQTVAMAQKDAESFIQVNSIKGNSFSSNGRQIVYSLPQNYFSITFNVKKVVKVAGPYANWAEKYLNITSDVITSNETNYAIEDVKINRFSVPDSSNRYAISYSNQDLAPAITLASNGMIATCNAHADITVNEPDIITVNQLENNNIEARFFDLGVKSFMCEEGGDEENEADSLENKKPTTIIPKTDEQNAEDAASFIRKLRKRRLKLAVGMSGEVNSYDGLAMQTMLAEIDKLEKSYIELFVGRVIESHYTETFTIAPTSSTEVEQRHIVWFSPSQGFTVNARKSDAVDIQLKITTLSSKTDVERQTTDASSKSSSAIRYGLYYREPAIAVLSIDCPNVLRFRTQTTIAQKGSVLSLPADYFNHKYSIVFDTETGALKSIILSK